MIRYIQSGKKLPPIVVRKTGLLPGRYYIIDGHHRVDTYKKMGINKIDAKIVPKKDIKFLDKYESSEDQQIGE